MLQRSKISLFRLIVFSKAKAVDAVLEFMWRQQSGIGIFRN